MGEATGGTVKVAVVGAGSVGTTLAYACLIRGVAQQVVTAGHPPPQLLMGTVGAAVDQHPNDPARTRVMPK